MVSAPLTHFDDVLTGFATGEWELLIKLVARVIGHLDDGSDQPGQGCSYELLFARILALGQSGALEVTGSGPGMRDYKVRRFCGRSRDGARARTSDDLGWPPSVVPGTPRR